MRKYTPFEQVAIGAQFYANGCKYVKKSTRTAIYLNCNRVFYFGKQEGVEVV